MYKVVTKRFLNEAKTICLFEIEAPLAARHAKAGQFVIFRLDEQGERIPVSVAGWDREKGTVTVMVQAAGRTTRMLHTVEEGDYISDFVGPLGKATEIEIQAKEMLRMREWLENTLAKHTGRDIEKIRKDIEVDTFLTAQEAKEYGIVDEVLEHRS